MSIVTLKKKSQAQYRNLSVGQPQFSINGTHRSQGYVGQTMLSRSLPRTLMNGIYPRGYGGCCGSFVIKPIVQSAVTSLNNPNIIKSSVISSKGMKEEELKCIGNLKIPNVNHDLPKNSPKNIVKPDYNQNFNTQEDYITRKAKKTIQNSICICMKSLNQIKNQKCGCNYTKYSSNFSKTQFSCTKQKNNMPYFLFSIDSKNISSYPRPSGLKLLSYANNSTFNNESLALSFFSGKTPSFTGGTIKTINFYIGSNNWSNLDSIPTSFTYTNFYGTPLPQNNAVSIFGYFLATTSGNWTFTLGANGLSNDDVSSFWIGSEGQTIESLKASATISNVSKSVKSNTGIANSNYSVVLTGGSYYPILLNWGQTGGGAVLGLGITPPGGTLTYDGTPYFFN